MLSLPIKFHQDDKLHTGYLGINVSCYYYKCMLLFPCRAVKVNWLGLIIKCRKVDLSVGMGMGVGVLVYSINQCWITGMALIIDYILEDDYHFDFILVLWSCNFNLFHQYFSSFCVWLAYETLGNRLLPTIPVHPSGWPLHIYVIS